MKHEGELGRSMPRPRRPSILQKPFSHILFVLNRISSLLVPRDWSRQTLIDILNNGDGRQDELIRTYIDCELAKMNTTGVTAALVAGVISSGFSWYNIQDTAWVTRAMWFSGLVLSIASVASSAIHTAAFLRIKCDRNVIKRLRRALGKDMNSVEGQWKPHVLTPYVLGGPTLYLKLAVLSFIIGLFYEIWRAAVAAHLAWHSDDLKIAFIVTLVGGFVVVNYIFSVLTLVHHSIHTTKE
ncbi:MAG: hypothetical protein Q9186_005950 [Xanthomendoza sp. 1 TL-2023]